MLTRLNQRVLESLPTFKIKCSTFPMAAHLVHDIFVNTEVHYRSSLTGADKGNMVAFFTGWNALEQNPGADINNCIQVPYSAWGVKASPNGLQDCNVQLPEVLLQPTTFVSPIGNGHKLLLENRKDWLLFHSILIPARNITDIHDDGVLSASLLVHVYRTKFCLPGQVARPTDSTLGIRTVRRIIFGQVRRSQKWRMASRSQFSIPWVHSKWNLG
jgi:hypothetical protein